MSILKAVGISKSFNHRLVVNSVNISVSSAEIIGLLGRNGAGKTTTFQIIVGLVKPDRGSIYLDSQNISSLPTYRRALAGITYLPQEDSVFLKATVEDNLKLVLQLQPLKKEEQEKIASRLLQELGLSHLAKNYAYTLSGGERRRLEICRSLILQPKFLLLDEPFTGIDPLTIKDLQKIMLSLKKRNIGIVLSDHNVRDTFKIANRAYIIDEGQILVEGTPQEIARDEKAKEKFLGKDFTLGKEINSYS